MKIAFNIGVSNVTNGDIQEWPLEYSSLKNTRSSLRFSLYAEWQCKKTAREKISEECDAGSSLGPLPLPPFFLSLFSRCPTPFLN